jgi:hypothetical protein
MVGQDGEMGLQHVAEVPYSLLDRQGLLIGAVFLLCRAQLPGEEDEGLTDALHSVEDGTHGGGRSVPYQGKWSSRNRMSQKCSSRQACFTFVDSCDACFHPGDGMRSFNLGTEGTSRRGAGMEAALGRKRW